MNATDILLSYNTPHHRPPIPNLPSIPLHKPSKRFNFNPNLRKGSHRSRSLGTFPRDSASDPVPKSDSHDDFVSRVLRENPSQVEPRYLVGSRFYTLREKENLNKAADSGIFQLAKKLSDIWGIKRKGDVVGGQTGEPSDPVYLKDILREFKGKLYVPEEVFRVRLSEEEEFDRNLQELPKMSFEDFQKAWKSDKIKLLTSKSVAGVDSDYGYRNFVVDLKEIPGDKQLQRTKWAMNLTENQSQTLLEEYRGPQYEIEKHTTPCQYDKRIEIYKYPRCLFEGKQDYYTAMGMFSE